MSEAEYIPKGSMCANCIYVLADCSGLDFCRMQVMYRKDGYTVVLCSQFKAKR